MDLGVLIAIAVVVIALVVAAITWFGPRPKQWETHDFQSTEPAEPLQPLHDVDPGEEATLEGDEIRRGGD